MRLALFAIILIFTLPAQAAVYKCTQANGAVKYQGTPCAGGAPVDTSRAGHADPVAAARANAGLQAMADQVEHQNDARVKARQASAKAHFAKRAKEKHNRHLVMMNQVGPGMTPRDVRRSWGSPSRINSDSGVYGTHEQWVYRRGDYRANYVYFENGEVTQVQNN